MALLSTNSKKLALLIDPEEYSEKDYLNQKGKIEDLFDVILVGGSSDSKQQIDPCVKSIKAHFTQPVYIFPGSHEQVSEAADGMLYLSLISGNNAQYLIGEHRKSALALKQLDLDIVPTGYVLVDGGKETSVQKVSQTLPLSQDDIETIVATSVAGELLGMKAIYLEAGSGAKIPVKKEIIQEVKSKIDIPLIVGGGIRSSEEIKLAFENGANLVVIGTFIEENTSNINQLKK
ncbi:MAG: phosphoglycerol geranylgeranyltransferase [Crocinitomicaceae bacterium]